MAQAKQTSPTMGNFFRQHLVGMILVSAIGGVLGNILTRMLPSPTDGGSAIAAVLLRPIPAWVLFPYSLLVTLAFGYWAVQSRRAERDTLIANEAAARHEAKAQATELEELRRAHQSVLDALQAATKQLESPSNSSLSKSQLMGLVAVVLAGTPPSALSPTNHQDVCRHVAGLAGSGFTHAAIGDALATMLRIGAVDTDFRGLTLSPSWKEKLARVSPSD